MEIQLTLQEKQTKLLNCTCNECGVQFKEYLSRVIDGRGKYCSKKCSNKHTLIKKGQHLSSETEFVRGKQHKHHKYVTYAGRNNNYRLIFKPDHPFSSSRGYVREHRLVMEEHLGRYLDPKEEIHHIDGNGLNNSIENLQLLSSKSEHVRLEHQLGKYKKHLHKLHIGGDA